MNSSSPAPEITSKKVECPNCRKYFSNKNNLKTHIQTIHHKILPYTCPYESCGKKYPNKSRYNVHIRIHLGIKPFKCNLCNQSFNESGNLKAHQLKHDTKRHFECPQCEKKYKSKGHLKEHIDIIHNNIKKYLCTICNKRFGKKAILTEHIRTHTKEKPFHCPYEGCPKSFAEKGNMKIHFKRHLAKKDELSSNYVSNENSTQILSSPESYLDEMYQDVELNEGLFNIDITSKEFVKDFFTN